MRRVGVRGSLLAGVSAVAVLLSVPALAEPAHEASQAAPSKDDYYTRRAKRILEAEKDASLAPHPLAALYPGMDVVVCEAGCPDRKGPEVVFAHTHVLPDRGMDAAEAREGYMVPTSSDDTAVPAESGVLCIGGCYGDMAYAPLPAPARVARTPAAPRVVESKDLPPRDKLSPVR